MQGWIGEKDDCTSHGEVFAYFLSTLDPRDFQATFDDNLLMTLCVPVVSQHPKNFFHESDPDINIDCRKSGKPKTPITPMARKLD